MSMQARPWCAAALIGALFFSIDGVAFDNGEGHHHHRALVRARQKVFGIENVNPETGQVRDDRVIFSWLTNTTYGVSLKGRVFLLDSYINRLELEPGRTPLTIQDLVDLQPGAILLGHGHGDHADNAAYLAKMLHNTTGPLKEENPALFDLMDTLPKTDVELGSIVSLGYDTNGVRDEVYYNVHILPKIYIPGHMTDVALPS